MQEMVSDENNKIFRNQQIKPNVMLIDESHGLIGS